MNKVYLDKIKQEDMEKIYSWFSDIDFLSTYDYLTPVPMSKEKVDKMLADYNEANCSVIFAIRTMDGGIVGIAGYDDIIRDNQVATLFIGIGDKESQGKGFGKEAIAQLIDYGFYALKLYRIELNVIAFNIPAIHLYEKSGFIKEGTKREFVLRNGLRYDLYMYARLNS